jgi:hypothetical protein
MEHACKVLGGVRNVSRNDAEVQPRRNLIPQIKCPSLFTDCNQTYSPYRACKEGANYGVSGSSLDCKPFVQHVRRVISVDFQENP